MRKEEDINYYMGVCFENNIKVYPVVYDRQNLKIEICYSGRKKTGTEKYRWASDQKKMLKRITSLYISIAKTIRNR